MYLCENCGKGFKSKKALAGHKAHCGKNHIKDCPVCGKEIHVSGMKNHLKYHEKEHPCENCGKLTHNNKFCSHSCAATYNNLGDRKHGKSPGTCLYCGRGLKQSARKYCSRRCFQDHRRELWINKIKERGTYSSTRQGRRYMLYTQSHQCEICGRERWEGEEIPLIADHIDGNPRNHDISNMRLICPNCDAQLPTYKGRNKGNGRYYRRERYADGKSY